MSNTPDEQQKSRASSVDDMAANIAGQLSDFKDEQAMLTEERTRINNRLKWLAGEIDKAERMTKALIPRHRSSTKKAEVD